MRLKDLILISKICQEWAMRALLKAVIQAILAFVQVNSPHAMSLRRIVKEATSLDRIAPARRFWWQKPLMCDGRA
jgi:predicted DCC family thiol-disulfide oxidoreductase YuxK